MLNDEAIRVLNCVRSKCMMIVHECLEDQAEGIQEEDMPDWISWQHFSLCAWAGETRRKKLSKSARR